MKIKKTVSIISTFLTLSLIAVGSISHAATISGTVFNYNGSVPVTGDSILVAAITGDPCGWHQWVTSAQTNPLNGTYEITGLSEGTYYLRTDNMNQSNYVNEWYTGQADPSSPYCGPAIQVAAGITGIDFYLDTGVSISGTVYNYNGSAPVQDAYINVAAIQGDPCGWRQWMGSGQTNIANGTYTIMGLPAGGYYLLTENMNQSNYVNEWYTGQADPSSPDCGLAIQVAAGTTGINFYLDMGGSISGTVFKSDGATPVNDANIRVAVIRGDPCEDQQWIGDVTTSDGTYTIMGLPAGDCYLRTDNMNQSNYTDEWWADPASVFYCSDAQAITVVAGGERENKNFQLDVGGSISGVVVDESHIAQENVEVGYYNEASGGWKHTYTGSDGSFALIGLTPGLGEIEVQPEVDTGLVGFLRDYCLNEGEAKDLGTIKLQNGALISGVLKDAYGSPLSYVEYCWGGKFEMGWGYTETDGSFAFRLPLGTYTICIEEEDEGYSAMPVEIVVTDVGTPQDLGTLTAYDSSSGEPIAGTVDYGGYGGPGEFEVVAFLNTKEITPQNAGGAIPLAATDPDPMTGAYSFYVVPQAQRVGTTVKVMLVLFHEAGGQETLTVVDTIEVIATPASGQNLSYSPGYAVSGFVKDGEGGIGGATVLLYKQPGDEFGGFADTACDGGYTIYNVRPGTYRIAVNAIDHHPDTVWSGNFEVVNVDVTVPDIFMGVKTPCDFDGDGKTDIAIYRAASGVWWINPSGPGTPYAVGFGGHSSDIPTPGDYDGDAKTDITIYRAASGVWWIRPSSTGTPYAVGFGGHASDIPVPGDYDSDGKSDVAVYRAASGVWWVRPSSTGMPYAVGFGGHASDIPVPGDYDSDGKSDVAVYRAASGVWWIRPSSTGTPYAVGFGGHASDIPVPGDYDGDGKSDVAVYRAASGVWWIRPSGTGTPYAVGFGGHSSDIPVPGDYDGDGKSDVAVYRAASGVWWIRPSGTGTPYAVGFGGHPSDMPVNPAVIHLY